MGWRDGTPIARAPEEETPAWMQGTPIAALQPGQPGYRAPGAPPPTPQAALDANAKAQEEEFHAEGIGPGILRGFFGGESLPSTSGMSQEEVRRGIDKQLQEYSERVKTRSIGSTIMEELFPSVGATRDLASGIAGNAQEAIGSIKPEQGIVEQGARALTAVPFVGQAARSSAKTIERGDILGGIAEGAVAAITGGFVGVRAGKGLRSPITARGRAAVAARSAETVLPPVGAQYRNPSDGAIFTVVGGEKGMVALQTEGGQPGYIRASQLENLQAVTAENTFGGPSLAPAVDTPQTARQRTEPPPVAAPPEPLVTEVVTPRQPLYSDALPAAPGPNRRYAGAEGAYPAEEGASTDISVDRPAPSQRPPNALVPLSPEGLARAQELYEKLKARNPAARSSSAPATSGGTTASAYPTPAIVDAAAEAATTPPPPLSPREPPVAPRQGPIRGLQPNAPLGVSADQTPRTFASTRRTVGGVEQKPGLRNLSPADQARVNALVEAAGVGPKKGAAPPADLSAIRARIAAAEKAMSEGDYKNAPTQRAEAIRELKDAEAVARGETPFLPGHTRLYRGRSSDPAKQGASEVSDGAYFSKDRGVAQSYADEFDGSEVVYTDIADDVLDGLPGSRLGPTGVMEVILPEEFAGKARPAAPPPAAPPSGGSGPDPFDRPAPGSMGRQIGLIDRIIRPSADVVTKAGGKSQEALEAVTHATERERTLAGKWHGEIQEVFELGLGGNRTAFERVFDTLDGTRDAATLTPKETAAVSRLRPLLEEIYAQAHSSVRGKIKEKLPSYAPHISSLDPPTVEARVAKMMDANPQLTKVEAIRIATRDSKGGYFQDPNLIREREGGMTQIRKDPEALYKYARDAAQYIGQSEASASIIPEFAVKAGQKTQVGAEFRFDPAEMITRVTEDIPNVEDRTYVQKFMQNELNLREDRGLVIRGFAHAMKVQAATSLMLSPLSQPLSLGVTAGRTSIKSTVKGIKQYLSARKEYEIQAVKGGSLEANISSQLQTALGSGGWTAKLPWIKGMNSMDKGLRVIADLSARSYLDDLAKAAAKGDSTAIRIMKEFGVKGTGIDDANRFARQIVDETQGKFTAGTTPNWMNTPAGRMTMQFTRLLYNQNKTLMKIASEARDHGNFKPLARLLTVGAVAGEITGDLKAILQGYGVGFVGGKEPESYKDIAGARPVALWDNAKTHEQNLAAMPKHLVQRLAQDWGRAATGGMAQMVLDRAAPAAEGQGKTIAEMSGPIGGTAERMWRAGTSSDPARNFAKEAVSTLGPPGRQLAREVFTPKGSATDYRPPNPGWLGRMRDIPETGGSRALIGGVLGDETAKALGISTSSEARNLGRETEAFQRAKALSDASRPKKVAEPKDSQEIRDDAKVAASRAEYRNRIREALVAGNKAKARSIVREARRHKIKIRLESIVESLEE